MLFTSLSFFVFLAVMFFSYWFAGRKSLLLQNGILLAGSYFFYGIWDWRFLLILFAVSSLNYLTGLQIGKAEQKSRKKAWLIAGLILNIATLSFFKYFNFFTGSLADLLSLAGLRMDIPTLRIILPLGISFYIFLAISYIVDIYRNKLVPERNFFNALLTFSFFPIILAGPIQRPLTLLPQLKKRREFDGPLATEGLKQILWGLFLKIVIADNCAVYVNDIFQNSGGYAGCTLLMGGILYTVQIYADFAGYSEIAIGISKLFGIEIMRNFAFPYFAKNISEFWKRWHISLTTWFRDYVFLPIALRVSAKLKKERILSIRTDLIIYCVGIIITWFLVGLWHGASYTFIAWGFIHGICLIVHHSGKKTRKQLLASAGISRDNIVLAGINRLATLLIVMMAWIVFRSETLQSCSVYFRKMFSASLFTVPEVLPVKLLTIITLALVLEGIQQKKKFTLDFGLSLRKPAFRWILYYAIILVILFSGGDHQQFVYFSF